MKAIVENPAKPTFGTLIVAWSVSAAGRVSGVFSTSLPPQTATRCSRSPARKPKLTELENDIAPDPGLFARVKATAYIRRLIRRTACCSSRPIRGAFRPQRRCASAADKELYRKYTSELSNLTLKFGQNSLAATNAFSGGISLT